MTEIKFTPSVEVLEGYAVGYFVIARWNTKCLWRWGSYRRVFESEVFLGRYSAVHFDCDPDLDKGWAEVKHIAATLNRWIPSHSAEELNTLVRHLPHATGVRGSEKARPASTDAEKGLLAEYRRLEQETIATGADANAKDQSGRTALMVAGGTVSDQAVIYSLLRGGANINATDNIGQTALMFAARNPLNPEIVCVLLKAGADARAADLNGMTAYDYAKVNPRLKGTAAKRRLWWARFRLKTSDPA
jgi:hypothetical protein